MKNSILILFGFILISSSVHSQTTDVKFPVVDVDSKTFSELIKSGKGVILDVRSPEEYAEAHIAGAKALNIFDKNFQTEIVKLPKDKEVYVYCAGGGRSADAANTLRKHGFKAYNLEYGLDEWIAKGYPVEK